MNPTVEYYSGHTYAQEPRALTWEGRRYLVAEVEARWRTPEGPCFCVRTESGQRFELHYRELDTSQPDRGKFVVLALPGKEPIAL